MNNIEKKHTDVKNNRRTCIETIKISTFIA